MKVENNMENFKVSIVIPAYNAANYLAEAIDSALAQTYPNVEILVINDGSKDDGATERIALSYGDKIRYFYKENGGSSSALNVGIANMTGEWFSWLSHDDLYSPDKIQKQFEYMSSLGINESDLPNHVFFASSELIDGDGNVIRTFRKKQEVNFSNIIEKIPHNGYLIAEPTVYNFHGCSCLVHKSVFESVGNFNENLRLLNDLDMWYRIYTGGYKAHYIPEPLVKGRIHAKQVSKSIGFSYHNSEQDMFWNRSINWILKNCPEEKLIFRFGRNAYLKTRNVEGDYAFSLINLSHIKKGVYKIIYKSRATARQFIKKIYLKLKM